jgi:hypothetical protein
MTYPSHLPVHGQNARQPSTVTPPVDPHRTPMGAVPPQNRRPAPPQRQLPTPPPAPRPYSQQAPRDDGRSDAAADSSKVAPSPRALGIAPDQLPQPLGQCRQGGEAGTALESDDRVLPACKLHAGHVGCQVRITRSDGRDVLAGVLAAVQHREAVAVDSVRTDLTVRWSDDSLVQVVVKATEMLLINPKQWRHDTDEPLVS